MEGYDMEVCRVVFMHIIQRDPSRSKTVYEVQNAIIIGIPSSIRGNLGFHKLRLKCIKLL